MEDFQDFQDIVDEKVIALPMHVHDFIDIPHGVSAGKFAESKPKMKDIMIFKFKRGSKLIYWKDAYQQEMFKVSHFLQKKYQKKNVELTRRNEPCSMQTEKRDNIVNK